MEAETETLPLWEMPLVQVHCDTQSWLVNSGSCLVFFSYLGSHVYQLGQLEVLALTLLQEIQQTP